MGSEWEKRRLGDLISIKSGLSYKSEFVGLGDSLLLGMGCVSNTERFLRSGARAYAGESSDIHLVTPGQLVIATRQQSDNMPILGFPAMIPESYTNKRVIVSTNLYKITNNSELSNNFLYWLLKSNEYKNHILSRSTGTTVRMITKDAVESFEFNCPPQEQRDRIEKILDGLDNKIQLNIQINQTLEQMAQTLFKSWFVDFDPVIDNALDAGNEIPESLQARADRRQKVRASQDYQPLPSDVRALFPSEFEENELGWVPKGWVNTTLDKLADILSGFAFKSNDFSDVGDAVIKIKNINSDRTVDISDVQCIPTSISLSAGKFKLGDGALIMAMTGATVGKFGLLVTENEEPYFLNQRVAKFEPKIDSRVGFLYCQLNREESEDFIVNTAQGSAQPNISASSILSMPLIIPSENLVSYFNSFVDLNFRKIIRNRKENIALTQFRDTLLPKLIAGELRLDGLPDEVVTATNE